MSLKSEKLCALARTREFMRDLLDRSKTKRIPLEIRRRAKDCLKHFPWDMDVIIRDDDGKFRLPNSRKK